MSVAEVKEAIDKMSDTEQLHVREYLRSKLLQNEEWRREISQRMREMDEGQYFTLEQAEALHRKLEAEGK